jgi:hypothetical protein
VYVLATATFDAIRSICVGFGPRYTLNPAVPEEKLNPSASPSFVFVPAGMFAATTNDNPLSAPVRIQRADRVVQV